MDLLTKFNQIPKEELIDPYAVPTWKEIHESLPRNINFNNRVKLNVEYITKHGDIESFIHLGRGLLINAAYASEKQKEEGKTVKHASSKR